ncbi:hypothetical protein FOZ62_031692, partial [Perkinsus olseni]
APTMILRQHGSTVKRPWSRLSPLLKTDPLLEDNYHCDQLDDVLRRRDIEPCNNWQRDRGVHRSFLWTSTTGLCLVYVLLYEVKKYLTYYVTTRLYDFILFNTYTVTVRISTTEIYRYLRADDSRRCTREVTAAVVMDAARQSSDDNDKMYRVVLVPSRTTSLLLGSSQFVHDFMDPDGLVFRPLLDRQLTTPHRRNNRMLYIDDAVDDLAMAGDYGNYILRLNLRAFDDLALYINYPYDFICLKTLLFIMSAPAGGFGVNNNINNNHGNRGGDDHDDLQDVWLEDDHNQNEQAPAASAGRVPGLRPRHAPPNLRPQQGSSNVPQGSSRPYGDTYYLPGLRVNGGGHNSRFATTGLPPTLADGRDNDGGRRRLRHTRGDFLDGTGDSDTSGPRSDRHEPRNRRGRQRRGSTDSDDSQLSRPLRRRQRRPTSNLSNSSHGPHGQYHRHKRHGTSNEYSLTSGTYFTPPQRATTTFNWCHGCDGRHCLAPITVKDFDTMQNVIRTLNPDKKFSGANDVRAGTTWVAEMYYHTEGHPDVVRYLWFKKYTSPRVWNEITS